MDPQATLYDLLDAMQRIDRVAINRHLIDLQEWNKNSGEIPFVHDKYTSGLLGKSVFRKHKCTI